MYEQDRLTLGRASECAGVSQVDLLLVLAAVRIPIHYGLDHLESDIPADPAAMLR